MSFTSGAPVIIIRHKRRTNMHKAKVFVLDGLFILAWMGIFTIVVWVPLHVILRFNHCTGYEYFTGNTPKMFIVVALLWIFLTIRMLIDCAQSVPELNSKREVYLQVFYIHPFLVAPTSYYIAQYRPKLLCKNNSGELIQFKSRILLFDMLYFVSYWGTIVFFIIMGINFVFIKFLDATLLIVIMFLFPVCVISTLILLTLLVTDSLHKSASEWQNNNFFKYLNTYSWIFGLRKYYLEILRPRLKNEGKIFGR